MADIEIEIDGKPFTATPDQTIIQVADKAGIYIPRFCYHKALTVAANCRMCLVEVEKSPKTLPACATPVMPGMKVFTRSQKTIEAQRAVMEFLLINHPLDCPICDQGGECELQDLSMGYGASISSYDECKRSVADEDIGPLVATDMTRCILCTRCVRFGDEIAGIRELGPVQRGGHVEIKTFVDETVTSEVSGNIIDLCPVGALTSKPYRFTARAWELQQAPSIAPHDCLGSNINVHTRYGKVMRVVSRENMGINETWLADRDRFGYSGLYHADRLAEPMARINGKWKTVEWQRAFEIAATGLNDLVEKHGADQLGALASPNATLEEFYLLQKLIRASGCANIDYRLRDTDTSDQEAMGAFPGLNMPIEALETCDAVLLVGSNIRKEQPLASLRLRKAARKGAAIAALNPVDYDFNFDVAAKEITAPHHMPRFLKAIAGALEGNTSDKAAAVFADKLRNKQKVCILLGAIAEHHPAAASLRFWAQKIATITGGTLSLMTEGANAAGAWLAGAVPHRQAGGMAVKPGLSADAMLKDSRKGYVLLNVEPTLDCANPTVATRALEEAEFVIALSMYRDPTLEAHADVIFPIAAFTETSGTYVNATGEWQSFVGVATPFESARPAWKVLRVLGNFLNLDGFDYESSEAIKHELKALVDAAPKQTASYKMSDVNESANGLSRIGDVPIYALDSLVRRAEPLQVAQAIMEGDVANVRLHPETAKQYRVSGEMITVKQAGQTATLPVVLDERIAKDAIWIASGVKRETTLGDLMGVVEIC